MQTDCENLLAARTKVNWDGVAGKPVGVDNHRPRIADLGDCDLWPTAMRVFALEAVPPVPTKLVRLARQHGKRIYYSLDEIPEAALEVERA